MDVCYEAHGSFGTITTCCDRWLLHEGNELHTIFFTPNVDGSGYQVQRSSDKFLRTDLDSNGSVDYQYRQPIEISTARESGASLAADNQRNRGLLQ